MTRRPSNHPHASEPRTSRVLLSYTVGFVLSVLLTLAAFGFSYSLGSFALPAIIGAAILQLMVQLLFFLHLGSTATPRAYAFVFLFTLVIVGILVGGTLWIMSNLDRLHMQPVTNADLYQGGQAAPQNELY